MSLHDHAPDAPSPLGASAAPDASSAVAASSRSEAPDTRRLPFDVDGWDAVVTAYEDVQRRRAELDAEEIRVLALARAVVADSEQSYAGRRFGDRSVPLRSMVSELAVAARLSEWTVKRNLGDAVEVTERFPAAVTALAEGRISRRHLAVIHDAGAGIEDDEARARYVELALERAEHTTPSRIGPVVEAIAARLNPRSVDERHAEANERRGVWVRARGDGMGDLILTGPMVLVQAGHDRLTQYARQILDARGAGHDAGADAEGAAPDERTMDQLRADVLTDLLLTGTPQTCTAGDGIDAIHAVVQVTVPVLTAAGAGSEPALLSGAGPIDAETARRLLDGATTWERVLTSPVTGTVFAVDTYKPCRPLERFLRARDERCRFPGCRRPARRCELDHTIPYSRGGPTCACNLADLCEHHHILKHHGQWTVRRLGGGILEWTSPTGRKSTDRPEPTVRFVPDTDPPPEPVEGRPPGTAAQWAADPDAFLRLHYDPHMHGPAPF